MKQLTIYHSRIEVDEEATAHWYENAEEWACDCAYCRNYLAAAKARKLPAELLDFLDSFTIPPEKAFYICMIPLYQGSDPDWREKGCVYELNFRFCGRILSAPEVSPRVVPFFVPKAPEPFWEAGFPEPYFDFCTEAVVPWLLEEDPRFT